jgi:hypothetical protein
MAQVDVKEKPKEEELFPPSKSEGKEVVTAADTWAEKLLPITGQITFGGVTGL